MPSLHHRPVHLGRGGSINSEPSFEGEDWYEAYVARHASDGGEGRLVQPFRFDGAWTSWEMHPEGDELVFCMRGEMVLHQQLPSGEVESIRLAAGDYAINPRGVWHTADTEVATEALFITSAAGTTHRPR